MTDKKDARIAELEEGLRQIAKGEGEFSRDHLTHAINTIESMRAIARDLLRGIAPINPRISELEEALRFYADGDSWRTRGHPQIDWNEKPVLHDGGKLAREVLGVSEEEFLKRLRG